MKPWLNFAFALLTTQAAQAAETPAVYRCGADGSVYQSVPCEQGRRVELKTDDPSASEHQAAVRSARQQLGQADRLMAEREARERSLRPALAAGFDARPAPKWTEAREEHRDRKRRKGKGKDSHKVDTRGDVVMIDPASATRNKR